MAPWSVAAAIYGVVLAVAALTLPIGRRPLAAVASTAYAMMAVGTGTLDAFWVHMLTPGALLLSGYWLSGFFFRRPQVWFEALLLDSDRRFLDAIGMDRWLERAPRFVLESLEGAYAADYIVVGGGALVAALDGIDALSAYWSLVLVSELSCYLALPWLRSRPPRALEPPGVLARRAPRLRQLNAAILDRASVQANTFPSGHVAGAVAAALALMSVSPALAAWVMAMAAVIAVAAVAGRYHYAIDCLTGAVVAIVARLLL